MGSVIKSIVSVLTVGIITVFPITAAILATVSDDFEKFLSEQFEVILGWFGIEDEDIVNVEVSDQLLFPEDEDKVADMLTQIAITHSKTDEGILSLLASSSNKIRGSYNSYFSNGENEFINGLPTTNLNAFVVPTAALKTIIDAETGSDVVIVTASKKVPTKEEYVYSRLLLDYDYSYSDNVMQYQGVEYSVSEVVYNYNTNNYDVIIGRRSEIVTTITVVVTPLNENTNTSVTTTTTVTVTNINPAEDNVNTVISEHTVVIGDVSGELSNITTELSNIDEIVPISTVVGSTTTNLEETTGTRYYADSINTTTAVHREVAEGAIPMSTTTVDVVAAIGTVSDSVTVESVVDNTYEAQTLLYVAPRPVHHYVVEYTALGSNSYWTYEISLGTYPELDTANAYITNLEMLPIVSIRNEKTSITADKASTEYLSTKNILKTIGLDVDTLVEGIEENGDIDNVESAHIHFGVDPKTEDPVIAKALFNLFDYIYQDSSLYNEDASSYIVTLSEGKYNASLVWKEFDRVIETGTIADLNECANTITTKSVVDSNGSSEIVDVLVLRKQVQPGVYVEYQITYLVSTTYISNQGFHNTSSGTLSEGVLTIPISKYFIDQLSSLEQMALFTKSLRLSVYAIDIQHLRYYQTAAFARFIKVVTFVIAIVIFIFTWYTGGATSAAFIAAVEQLIIGMVISYAFTLLLESTDNAALQAIFTAIAVAIMVYSGQVDGAMNTTFLSANMLTTAVQVHTGQGYDRLSSEQDAFSKGLISRQKEFDDERKAQEIGLGTSTITGLSLVEPNKGYIEGIDSFMFRAKGQVQYQYSTLFDYDRPFDIYENAYRLDLNKSLS